MKFLLKNLSTNDVYSLIHSSRLDSIFALPHFVDLEVRDYEKTCFYVEINDVETGLGTVTPVVISKLRMGLKIAFCPSPPQIIHGFNKINKRWREILNTLIHHIKQNHNCMAISMNQRPHDHQFVRSNTDGCKLSHNHDIVIDLSHELHAIYYGMDKRHRYTLRKASVCSDDELLSSNWLQKTGFMIRQGVGQESLREFRLLWIKTLKRMYGSFNPLRKLLYRDPLTFKSLIAVFNQLYPHGLVKLFTIYDNDGQPGASAIFYTSDNFTKIPMAYWSAGASSKEGRRKGLPLLLQWYIIQWFKEYGYQRYYMGGYNVKNPNDGPSLFKRGFGGQIVSGFTVTWRVQPLRAMYNLISHTARLTNAFRRA